MAIDIAKTTTYNEVVKETLLASTHYLNIFQEIDSSEVLTKLEDTMTLTKEDKQRI